jgi:hypothetical protein
MMMMIIIRKRNLRLRHLQQKRKNHRHQVFFAFFLPNLSLNVRFAAVDDDDDDQDETIELREEQNDSEQKVHTVFRFVSMCEIKICDVTLGIQC